MKKHISPHTHFAARFTKDGVECSRYFERGKVTQAEAEQIMAGEGIADFFLMFAPFAPLPFGENGMIFKGDIGFDITVESMLPSLQAGKEIILDSFGGDLWEGWKLHDTIKALGTNPSIGILGSCASATTLPLLATENRWSTPNSRFLIHNPWTMAVGDDSALYRAAGSLEKEKLATANMYARVSGRSVDEMLALMIEERFMSAAEMLEYNFINEIRNEIEPKNEEMTKEEITAALDKQEASLLGKIKAWMKPKSPKNAVFQDVNGVDLDFGDGVETLEQIVVGATATVDGAPAVGEFVLSNGNTYVFEAGAVTSIIEADGDDLEAENAALKAELEALKAEKASASASIAALTSEIATVKASALKDLKAVKADFDSFRTKFSSEPPVANVPDGPPATDAAGGFKFKRK